MKNYPSVYIAGPDIFLPSARAFYAGAAEFCRVLELTALTPYAPHLLTADEIFQHNLEMLRKCDGVVANCEPFRGAGADDGTAFEKGFAHALGKPIVSYLSNDREVYDKTTVYMSDEEAPNDPDPAYVFSDGMTAECWGYPLNLMLQKGASEVVRGSLHSALIAMKGILHGTRETLR
jgi:nucleoside 2-deoxyribosyltransferase